MERKTTCPICMRKDKLFINDEKEVGHCKYCDEGWSTQKLREYGLLENSSAPVRRHGHVVHKDPALEDPWMNPDAIQFMAYGRKFPITPAMSPPGLKYDPDEKRLYFPIWSPSPEFRATYHTRTILPDTQPKWRAVHGTKKHHYIFGRPFNHRAVLVEGIWDAIQIGLGAVALLGTDLSETHVAYLRKCRGLMAWMDPDEAGQKAQRHITTRFRALGVPTVSYMGPAEPGDLHYQDPHILAARKWLKEGTIE